MIWTGLVYFLLTASRLPCGYDLLLLELRIKHPNLAAILDETPPILLERETARLSEPKRAPTPDELKSLKKFVLAHARNPAHEERELLKNYPEVQPNQQIEVYHNVGQALYILQSFHPVEAKDLILKLYEQLAADPISHNYSSLTTVILNWFENDPDFLRDFIDVIRRKSFDDSLYYSPSLSTLFWTKQENWLLFYKYPGDFIDIIHKAVAYWGNQISEARTDELKFASIGQAYKYAEIGAQYSTSIGNVNAANFFSQLKKELESLRKILLTETNSARLRQIRAN